MPEISRFFGIIITMFYGDHQPPHFHVRYGEYKAQVTIDPISILRRARCNCCAPACTHQYANPATLPDACDTPCCVYIHPHHNPTPPSGGAGRVAYLASDDNDWEIYVMNSDGTNPIQLTDNDVPDWVPAWSADGREIAFESDREDGSGIYVMDADGTNEVKLLDYAGGPAWSP